MTRVEIIPFVAGRRPTDEARSAGQGSSEPVAFVNAGDENRCLLLLEARGRRRVRGHHGHRPPHPAPVVHAGAARRTWRVLALDPDTRLRRRLLVRQPLLADRHRDRAPRRRGGVDDGARSSTCSSSGRCTSASSSGSSSPTPSARRPWLSHTVHPWFPVLLIGAHKAELYTRALVGDVVHKRQNLADPGWLTRVGLYLELMTALGVIEAVRDDLGDLLTPEERAAADSWDDLTINVDGWREVWALRKIAQPIGCATCWPRARRRSSSCTSTTRTSSTRSRSPGRTARTRRRPGTACSATPSGPCCARRRTRSRSWRCCPTELRRFVLWHRRGQVGLRRALRVPGPLPQLVGDQDGLFASACNQYRASMNHVAEWARGAGPDGARGRRVRPAPGQPARGAHEPAVARGAAAGPGRLRPRAPARGRRGPAARLHAAARRTSRRCWARRRSSRR